MRKIREVLRLRAAGLSHRQIARSLGLGRTAVGDYLARAQGADLAWPLPEGRSEADLERLLFPEAHPFPERGRPLPDWARVHRELHRPGVTLSLLWQEYRADHGQRGCAHSNLPGRERSPGRRPPADTKQSHEYRFAYAQEGHPSARGGCAPVETLFQDHDMSCGYLPAQSCPEVVDA